MNFLITVGNVRIHGSEIPHSA